MAIDRSERGEETAGRGAARAAKPAGLLGSLKDALRAAGRDDFAQHANEEILPPEKPAVVLIPPMPSHQSASTPRVEAESLSAAEAARLARTVPEEKPVLRVTELQAAEPPTTRVVRPNRQAAAEEAAPRTRLVRGRQPIVRDTFAQDPVVGFLIVVGGPGLGASRSIYEGNNTVGRSTANRIPLDFGDETISSEAQAYIRYDSTDRSFLFVPNLAKTNVVSVNDKRPSGAVELKPMDIVTFGRTQVAFLPFCGPDFDWSEISDAKDE